MITTNVQLAASVMSFGPIPVDMVATRCRVMFLTLNGASDSLLTISAAFMRRQVKTSGLVASSGDWPVIAPSSTLMSYTAVALNTAPGPFGVFDLPIRFPLPDDPGQENWWFNIELETVTNLRVVVAIEMEPSQK